VRRTLSDGWAGGDRIASCAIAVEFFVVEEQRSERPTHVTFDVVGEHAQEDVSGSPAQFFEISLKRRCSLGFHLEAPGG
jgi:hypothetical protein